MWQPGAATNPPPAPSLQKLSPGFIALFDFYNMNFGDIETRDSLISSHTALNGVVATTWMYLWHMTQSRHIYEGTIGRFEARTGCTTEQQELGAFCESE